MEVIYLYLVMDTYVHTWQIGSRTKLQGYRMCQYREINSQDPQTYTWYVPWSPVECPPYVVHEVSNG